MLALWTHMSLMINNCDIAVSMYAYYDKQNLFWEYQDTALEYFGDAFDICILIYEDTDYTILNNPYIVILQDKLVLAFSFISVRKLSELVDPILDYAKKFKCIDEMGLFCSQELIREGEQELEDFEKRESCFMLALELTQNNLYKTAEIYLDLYDLYVENDQKELGKQYLEKAYKISGDTLEIYVRPLYCNILRAALKVYRRGIDRDNIIETLLKIIPQIYGTDSRKKHIYETLREELLTIKDQRLKEVCIELLQIEIKFDVMEDLYDICNKGNEKMKFIGYINLIIMKKDSLSLEECNVIEKFFREKEEYIGSDIARNLYDIIKKFKRGGNKGGFIENREYIGNKEIQLSKLEHKEKNWGFFENINISESDINKYSEFDLRKELEKKFDELFGPID